jgi:diaminohydroxyphosphoribosylaminopyrimidine deaminase/5-amino-6-(5-phosphoribosylamino)uracil reductase
VPTWLVCLADAPADRRRALEDAGVSVLAAPAGADGDLHLPRALGMLAVRGITRVLCEGGSRLAAALLRDGLVDRIAWFRAPRVIGGDGLAAAAGFGIETPAAAPAFRRLAVETVGEDLFESYARA